MVIFSWQEGHTNSYPLFITCSFLIKNERFVGGGITHKQGLEQYKSDATVSVGRMKPLRLSGTGNGFFSSNITEKKVVRLE